MSNKEMPKVNRGKLAIPAFEALGVTLEINWWWAFLEVPAIQKTIDELFEAPFTLADWLGLPVSFLGRPNRTIHWPLWSGGCKTDTCRHPILKTDGWGIRSPSIWQIKLDDSRMETDSQSVSIRPPTESRPDICLLSSDQRTNAQLVKSTSLKGA